MDILKENENKFTCSWHAADFGGKIYTDYIGKNSQNNIGVDEWRDCICFIIDFKEIDYKLLSEILYFLMPYENIDVVTKFEQHTQEVHIRPECQEKVDKLMNDYRKKIEIISMIKHCFDLKQKNTISAPNLTEYQEVFNTKKDCPPNIKIYCRVTTKFYQDLLNEGLLAKYGTK